MDKDFTPLRAYRLSQTPKMRLRDLAERVGMSQGQLSRIEREGTESLPTAMKLAEVTKLPVEAFARSRAA